MPLLFSNPGDSILADLGVADPKSKNAKMAHRLLSFAELPEHGITYSRRHLKRMEREGRFPPHVTIGEGVGARIGWVESLIDEYVSLIIAGERPRYAPDKPGQPPLKSPPPKTAADRAPAEV
jgi:predicted DNA-binding transcriptional regulator AlpA